MLNINQARRILNAKLMAVIHFMESESAADCQRYALELFEVIGFIRGRTNDQTSLECQILHRIKEAYQNQDLSGMWKLQDEWAEFRHGR